MKRGDRVRVKGKYYPHPELSPGQTGVVIEYDEDCVEVRMDSGFTSSSDDMWPFLPDELEVIQ